MPLLSDEVISLIQTIRQDVYICAVSFPSKSVIYISSSVQKDDMASTALSRLLILATDPVTVLLLQQ